MEQNEKNYDKIDDILDELDDLEDNETDLDIDDNVHVNLVKEEKKGEDGGEEFYKIAKNEDASIEKENFDAFPILQQYRKNDRMIKSKKPLLKSDYAHTSSRDDTTDSKEESSDDKEYNDLDLSMYEDFQNISIGNSFKTWQLLVTVLGTLTIFPQLITMAITGKTIGGNFLDNNIDDMLKGVSEMYSPGVNLKQQDSFQGISNSKDLINKEQYKSLVDLYRKGVIKNDNEGVDSVGEQKTANK